LPREQATCVRPAGLCSPPRGAAIDYHNWRNRVWAQVLNRAGVSGMFHMLRHLLVTALIPSG